MATASAAACISLTGWSVTSQAASDLPIYLIAVSPISLVLRTSVFFIVLRCYTNLLLTLASNDYSLVAGS